MNTRAQYHHYGTSPQVSPSNTPATDNNLGKSTVYMPTNSSHLNHIFDSITSQIQQQNHNVQWKLELTFFDDRHPHDTLEPPRSGPTNSPLVSSPAITASTTRHHIAPSGVSGASSSSPSTQYHNHQRQQQYMNDDGSLAITSRTQYPWDFVVPLSSETWSKPIPEEIQHQLKDANDRQKYMEDVIHAQAVQIGRSTYLGNDAESAIATMRSIYLMMANEQKLRYTAEIKLQHKKITMLDRKLKRLASILETIESIQPATKETGVEKDDLLQEKRQLLRKLHLAELRLSARDAEMEYIIQQQQLYSAMKHYNSNSNNNSTTASGDRGSASPDSAKTARRSPTPHLGRKGPPYLFQQQYSPKMRSSIRPSTTNRHHQKLSGLESLGILADHMLSDPDFEHNKASPTIASSPLKQSTTLPLSHHHQQQQQQQQQHRSYQLHGESPSPKLQKHNMTPSSKPPLSSSLGSSHQQYSDQHSTYRPSEPFDDVPWVSPANSKSDNAFLERQPRRSKRSIDSATALLSIPMLSSSFHPIAESPERELDAVKKRTRLYNVTTWAPDEDDQLRHSVSFYGSTGNWEKIANTLQGRSSQQCQQRWEILNSSTTTPTSAAVAAAAVTRTPEPTVMGGINARQSPSIAALLDNTDGTIPLPASSSLAMSPLASTSYQQHSNTIGDRLYPPSSLYQSHSTSHTP
ncbi:hypothetical protein [Absidia glauca]|uniref:Uncharacterized protein n=1 Tax=Absidia glauca TaxID=4829 RepID=A0A163MDS3_ABSGL|nr:hypothetical protein [Absidia glauca]